MKKLLLLSLVLSNPLKAQISIGNILNTNEANQMSIGWKCAGENYPNVNQLPEDSVISIKVRNNGKLKITPNIFDDGFKPKKILSMLGLQAAPAVQKQPVSVNDSACMETFMAKVKAQFAQNTKNCANDNANICKLTEASFVEAIQKQIDESDYAKKTKGSHKLPRILAFNNSNTVDYPVFNKQISAFCEDKEYDKELVLTGGFLRQVNNYSSYVNGYPGTDCLEKLKVELDNYSKKVEAEHCEASPEVCDYLKAQRADVARSLEEIKTKRAAAVAKQEETYKQKINPDWDKEFDSSFTNMIEKGRSNFCNDFTTNLSNAGNTKVASPVTMTNLVTKNMDSLFAKMDAQCQQQFIRQYIEQNSFERVVGDTYNFRLFCAANKTAKICDSNRQYTADIEKNLEKMLQLAYGEYGKDYFREQLLACEKENLNDLNDLLGKLKDFDKKMTCAPLKEGESKVVSSYSYPTGLSGQYALKKTGPNETTAIMNMNFTAVPGSPLSGEGMEKRVKECMQNISPYLKGGNGESLKIVVVNPDEASKLESNMRPPVNQIKVGSTSRSNSGFYDSNDTCTTITHEVMHLFGLCDEYKENWTGAYVDVDTGNVVSGGADAVAAGTAKAVTAYNCRNVPTIPSIMKNQEEAFEKAIPKNVRCECVGEDCKKIMSSAEPLQKLFQNYGWDVIDNYYLTKFCKSSSKPGLTTSQYLANPQQFKLLSEATDVKLEYNFKTSTADGIKSYDMRCDCSKPYSNVEDSDVETCKEIVNNVSKSIAEGTTKSNRSCPPGTVQKDSQWGGQPETESKFDGTGYRVFKPKPVPGMASLLYPAQFDRIVGGACPDVTPVFNQCSQFAYKTKGSAEACKVPEECKDMNKLMGIPQ